MPVPPTPNIQQPQPGPSPTPPPKPTHAIRIASIEKVSGGANINPESDWITSTFFVTDEYLETCNPESGGYFVEFEDVVCFMSATELEAAYGWLKQNVLAFRPAWRETAGVMRLPANWKTTASMIGGVLMAALTFLSTVSYDQGAIALIIPQEFKPWVTKIAGIAALVLFCINGMKQKDKNVTGGTTQQTVSGAVADAGTQSMVDATVKASIASGDPSVTPEQKAAVQT